MIAGVRERIRLQREALELAERYAGEVARRWPDVTAVLFGSYARGDFHDGSDVDLLLVSEGFHADPMERGRLLYELSPGGIDIFAYRPPEFRRMLAKNHPTAYWARREGRVLRDAGFWRSLELQPASTDPPSPSPRR